MKKLLISGVLVFLVISAYTQNYNSVRRMEYEVGIGVNKAHTINEAVAKAGLQLYLETRMNIIDTPFDIVVLATFMLSCTKGAIEVVSHPKATETITPQQAAQTLLAVRIDDDVVREVFQATQISVDLGMDESYRFAEILDSDNTKICNTIQLTRSGASRILGDRLKNIYATRASLNSKTHIVDLNRLKNSDVQIDWPYSENWDQKTAPIVAYMPDGVEDDYNPEYI